MTVQIADYSGSCWMNIFNEAVKSTFLCCVFLHDFIAHLIAGNNFAWYICTGAYGIKKQRQRGGV